VQRREATENLPKSLPAGFPEKLSSPPVWKGKDTEKQMTGFISSMTRSERRSILH
jgi:hypothetical protein